MGSASFANPDSYSSLLVGCIHQPWCPNVLWASVVNSQLSGRSRTGVEQLIEPKSWFNYPGTCTYSPYTTIGNSNVQIQTLSSVAHVKIKAHQGGRQQCKITCKPSKETRQDPCPRVKSAWPKISYKKDIWCWQRNWDATLLHRTHYVIRMQ